MKLRIRDRLFWGLEVSSGGRAFPAGRLFVWTPPGYSRKKFRNLVSRLVRAEQLQQLVVGGEVQLRLAAPGRKLLLKSFPILEMNGKTWDGFWRVVIFDIPESRRKERDNLRRRLIRMGFGRMQDSVYFSPYDWGEGLEAKQKNLGEPKVLAAKIWPLKELAAGYNKVIDRLTTRFGIKEAKKREDFLRKTHQEYLEVMLADPFLPPELLPADWPAAKCRKFLLQAGVVKS